MNQAGKNNPAYKHGHTTGGKFTSTYHSWASMLARCYNPNVTHYRHYGGRGIRVCTKWKRFEGFFADMGARPPGTSIDRVDVNKGYNKGNCRWATGSQQMRNRARFVTSDYCKRILRLCKKPKRLVDLPSVMGLHFEVVRKEVRHLVSLRCLEKTPVQGNHPRGKTLLLQTTGVPFRRNW